MPPSFLIVPLALLIQAPTATLKYDAPKDVAKTAALKTSDFALTVIDLPGTYMAETSPGSPERHNKPGFTFAPLWLKAAAVPIS